MFRAACEKALQFVHPVIISQRHGDGRCSGGIGAFVLLNNEGWIATCHHIAEMITNGLQSENNARKLEAERDRINADATISNNQKRKQIEALPKLKKSDVDRIGVLWAIGPPGTQTQVPQFQSAPAIDLAVGKLDPFDPGWVTEYPKLKDPDKNFAQGATLCRVGYPFHAITPTWDNAANGFALPQNALPVPRFAIDGMVTRLVNVELPLVGVPPFPMMLFETSSPGLRGQSGGAIFDTDANIWGIQTDTVSYPLGFDPEVPNSNPKQKVHQFLNVGRCIHAGSIIGMLKMVGAKYDLSAS